MSGVALRRRIRGRIGDWGRRLGLYAEGESRSNAADGIRALSKLMKVSKMDAGEAAVKEKPPGELERREATRAEKWREAQRLVEEFRKLPVVGPRLTDADLYDEDGMPKSFDI